MKSLLIAMAALPLMAGGALAAQPLSDNQMDQVNAGNFGNLAEAFASATAFGRDASTFTQTNAVTTSYSASSFSSSAAFTGSGHH